jgi:predicted amidohydrolase
MMDVEGARVGFVVCFGVTFPKVARTLRRSRVAGHDLHEHGLFGRNHEVFSTVRALENGLPHLYVDQGGKGKMFVFASGKRKFSA